jgi:hypothetical protein
MKLSNKKKREIALATVWPRVLSETITGTPFWDYPPDTWNGAQQQLFDIATEIEDKLKEKIITLIESSK